jgi:hypothetical protein
MIKYKIDYNIGKVKYLVSFYEGIKKHKDGSEFWDIKCFKSKLKMYKFLKELTNNIKGGNKNG